MGEPRHKPNKYDIELMRYEMAGQVAQAVQEAKEAREIASNARESNVTVLMAFQSESPESQRATSLIYRRCVRCGEWGFMLANGDQSNPLENTQPLLSCGNCKMP